MRQLRQKLRLIILAYFTAFATSIPEDRHINAQMIPHSRCGTLQTWKSSLAVMFGYSSPPHLGPYTISTNKKRLGAYA